ncbi:MAG: sensor histidine kinase [Pirellulaceae bacterium]|nr:sensor histidine kinase [Pirellulaceae bacterium]
MPDSAKNHHSESGTKGKNNDLYSQERELLAFEIHDGLLQELTAALMFVHSAADLLEEKELTSEQKQSAHRSLETGISLIQNGMDEARQLMRGLQPPGLKEFGLKDSVHTLLGEFRGRISAQIKTNIDLQIEPSMLVSANVYRIIQESLHNIRKHSSCTQVEVALTSKSHKLSLRIQDNGQGFDPEKTRKGALGLIGIRRRTDLLRGSVQIDSAPTKGTTLSVTVPLD